MQDEYPEILHFCYWGNPILRRVGITVEDPESTVTAEFIEKMREKLEEHDGLGLAAHQVGCDRKICLVCFPKKDDYSDVRALVNPEIIERSEETEIAEEGCLSFPKLYVDVERAAKIKVRAYFPGDGEKIFEAEGLLARILQHEIDHLNGVVFIDHLTFSARSLLKKDLSRIAKSYGGK
jgi:peptide deformylase